MNDKLFAAVDLGSNSFHLLIARCDELGFHPVKKARQPVRLASHVDEQGVLAEEGQAIALSCLRQFKEVLLDYPNIQIKAVATAAFRRIQAPTHFFAAANDALGQEINIITGREEARYIYHGVCSQLKSHTPISRLIIDIGGGSTEIVIGEGENLSFIESFPMGCVLLQKQYYAAGTVSEQTIHSMQHDVRAFFKQGLAPLKEKTWQNCFASSGTAQTLKLLQKQQGMKGAISTQFVDGLLSQVQTGDITSPEYAAIKPDRQLIFPAGLVILTTVLSLLNVEKFFVSKAALREGVLASLSL